MPRSLAVLLVALAFNAVHEVSAYRASGGELPLCASWHRRTPLTAGPFPAGAARPAASGAQKSAPDHHGHRGGVGRLHGPAGGQAPDHQVRHRLRHHRSGRRSCAGHREDAGQAAGQQERRLGGHEEKVRLCPRAPLGVLWAGASGAVEPLLLPHAGQRAAAAAGALLAGELVEGRGGSAGAVAHLHGPVLRLLERAGGKDHCGHPGETEVGVQGNHPDQLEVVDSRGLREHRVCPTASARSVHQHGVLLLDR
eukprot:scaffold53_cov193-Pinguiococcus_pyrenoidosus.AAC.43